MTSAKPILRTGAFAGLLVGIFVLLAFMYRDLGRIRECEAARTEAVEMITESTSLTAQCIVQRDEYRAELDEIGKPRAGDAEPDGNITEMHPDPYLDMLNQIAIHKTLMGDGSIALEDDLPPEDWCALRIASPAKDLGVDWYWCVRKLMEP